MNLGGYTIESVVSESPTAVVYKVRHPTLQSVHACKVMPQIVRDIPSVRSALLQRIQWRIEHQSPFFIRVTDVIETDQNLGFIMDWLEGRTLKEHLDRYGKVEVLPSVRWVVQVLSALHTFHADQLIHLDIHPGNVFLQQSDKGAMAILMDDGIHRHMHEDVHHISTGVDRLRYQAPEEVHQKNKIGPWTDVYRIGVVFYQMLVGRTPFGGDTEYSVMHAINGGRYQNIVSARPDVSTELASIIDTAIHKDPTKRYQSAHEMLVAIQSTIPLPDVFEPIEATVFTEESETPDVDILIEQDGEWILQSSEVPESEDPDDASESRSDSKDGFFKPVQHIKSSEKRVWQVPPMFWRFRWQLFMACLILIGFYVLWLGGIFGGRESVVEIQSAPMWGTTKAKLDQEYMPAEQSELKLSLGQHQVDVTGGVSVSGGCGRCCWSHTESFTVPFGWGVFRSVVDLEEIVDDLACPTIEHEYLFEKVNLRQGMMGAPNDLPMRADNSLWHQVQLITPFWMAKTEVTQELYTEVMNVPFSGEAHWPQRDVTWKDAIEFCNRLSDLEGLETCYQIDAAGIHWEKGVLCEGYRLPTEAEWELSARAKSPLIVDGKFYWFSGGSNASLLAWYGRNSGQKVHSVGTKYPNAFGLYDMSGNISEWVWDGYTPHLGNETNPKGIRSGKKVIRGGHFRSPETQIRVFDRGYASESYRSETIGFRIVRSVRNP